MPTVGARGGLNHPVPILLCRPCSRRHQRAQFCTGPGRAAPLRLPSPACAGESSGMLTELACWEAMSPLAMLCLACVSGTAGSQDTGVQAWDGSDRAALSLAVCLCAI